MGGALAAVLRAPDREVAWSSPGRSSATAARAENAGLVDAGPLVAAVGDADLVLSVCPPHAAADVAADVAAAGFAGTYVDANAISPRRMVTIVAALPEAQVIDASILGPPPNAGRPGATRLFLCGDGAGDVASIFESGAVQVTVLPAAVGAASALKAAFAAWTKGSAALAAVAAALADAHGLLDVVLAEWAREPAAGVGELIARLPGSAAKAWRWSGEMEEIADTCRDAGVIAGFHHAAADVWDALASWKDAERPPLEALLAALRAPHSGEETPP
jgi:hypothetical protein